MRRAVAAALLAATLSSPALGWGPIGHRIVAESAALLVADDLPGTWGPLFARHRFELGFYSFLPDARFRFIDGAEGKLEAPTHFLNLDALPGAKDTGSVDRRIAQFLDLARGELGGIKKLSGGYQRGTTATGDSRRLFVGLYDLGLMAHYSGDVSMPYHATSDWNGTARGEGGIHYYFEGDCVNVLEPGLAAKVLAEARAHRASWTKDWRAGGGPPAWIRSVLADSLETVKSVGATDREAVVTKLQEPGSRKSALRKPPAEGCQAFETVLVERLARGAALTAALWESVLPPGVDFTDAAGLQFSDMVLSPDYVPPR